MKEMPLEPAPRVVVGFCTYNRVDRLPTLVAALRAQHSDEPFEIVVVNNNSPDDTARTLDGLASQPGPRLRYVTETQQGIVPARNRLLAEARSATHLLMLDDDELPQPGWLQAGLTALRDEHLDCVGGRVRVNFSMYRRPSWLGDDLLGFLAQVDHGQAPLQILDPSTPIWTANVGYRMALFATDLKFDSRYSRVGTAVGGGEDVVMFESLLNQGSRIGYRPNMVVDHFVEPWRLNRRYFLRVHYSSGVRAGMYTVDVSGRRVLGVPLYLIRQALRQAWRTLVKGCQGRSDWLRQGMNFTHACGLIVGTMRRSRSRTVA